MVDFSKQIPKQIAFTCPVYEVKGKFGNRKNFCFFADFHISWPWESHFLSVCRLYVGTIAATTKNKR